MEIPVPVQPSWLRPRLGPVARAFGARAPLRPALRRGAAGGGAGRALPRRPGPLLPARTQRGAAYRPGPGGAWAFLGAAGREALLPGGNRRQGGWRPRGGACAPRGTPGRARIHRARVPPPLPLAPGRGPCRGDVRAVPGGRPVHPGCTRGGPGPTAAAGCCQVGGTPAPREPRQAPSFKADLTPPSQMSRASAPKPPSQSGILPRPFPRRPCPGHVDHSMDAPAVTPPPAFEFLTRP